MNFIKNINIIINGFGSLRDIYRAAANNSDDPKGFEVLDAFERETLTASEFLTAVVDKLQKGEKLKKSLFKSIIPSRQWIEQGNVEIQKIIIGKDYSEEVRQLRVACDHVENIIRSIAVLVAEAEGNLRTILNSLLKALDGHIALLLAEINSLENHGFWYDFAVFYIEDY